MADKFSRKYLKGGKTAGGSDCQPDGNTQNIFLGLYREVLQECLLKSMNIRVILFDMLQGLERLAQVEIMENLFGPKSFFVHFCLHTGTILQ